MCHQFNVLTVYLTVLEVFLTCSFLTKYLADFINFTEMEKLHSNLDFLCFKCNEIKNKKKQKNQTNQKLKFTHEFCFSENQKLKIENGIF